MYRPSPNDYDHYRVDEKAPLLEWLLANVKGESRSKIKATLKGRGIKVNGKQTTRFDYPLEPGMKISVSRNKRNDTFRSRYVRLVYEDRHIVVLEKAVGILSMAAGHSSLNVKKCLTTTSRRRAKSVRPMWSTASTATPAA